MSQILHIQSSSNLAGSVSRQLSAEFVRKRVEAEPGTIVVVRDLMTSPVPHLGADLFGGLFAKPEVVTGAQRAALAVSDALVDEIEAASMIVIGAPMYNFGIPSALKAWIDHICRAGRTFRYTAAGPEGLVHGKRLVLVLASGGVYSAGPSQGYDFQETYLRAILGFIGLTDVTVIRAEGLAKGAEQAAESVAAARGRVEAFAA